MNIVIPSSVVNWSGRAVMVGEDIYRVDNNLIIQGNYLENNSVQVNRGVVADLAALQALNDASFEDKCFVSVTNAYLKGGVTPTQKFYHLERNPNPNELLGSAINGSDLYTVSVPTLSGNGRWVMEKAVTGTAFYLEAAGAANRNTTFLTFANNTVGKFEKTFHIYSEERNGLEATYTDATNTLTLSADKVFEEGQEITLSHPSLNGGLSFKVDVLEAISESVYILSPSLLDGADRTGVMVAGSSTWANSNIFRDNKSISCRYHYHFVGNDAANRNRVEGALCEMSRYPGHYAVYLENNSSANEIDFVLWDSFGIDYLHKSVFLDSSTYDNVIKGQFNYYKVANLGRRNHIHAALDFGERLEGTILPQGTYSRSFLPSDNFLFNIDLEPGVTITYAGPLPVGAANNPAAVTMIKRLLRDDPKALVSWSNASVASDWIDIKIEYTPDSRFEDNLQIIGALFRTTNSAQDAEFFVKNSSDVWVLYESIRDSNNEILYVDTSRGTSPGVQNHRGLNFRFRKSNGTANLVLTTLFAYGGEVKGGNKVNAYETLLYGGLSGLDFKATELEIVSGAVTMTGPHYPNLLTIKTEGGAALDDLTHIYPVIDGKIIICQSFANANDVNYKGNGNIVLPGGWTDMRQQNHVDKILMVGQVLEGSVTVTKWKVMAWNLAEVVTGTTAARPTVNLFVGKFYYDTTLVKPIFWDGAAWRDFAGVLV